MPPLTQSTRRRRRMTHGDGGCARIEHEQHWRADRGESGLGAGVAHGEGAHLLGMKEGIIAEVPARSQLACAPHGGAGVRRVVCWTTSFSRCLYLFISVMPRAVDTCEEFQAEPNVADCVEIKFRAPHAIDATLSP